ncbi:MAG: Spy/CpxP family protein refolding chaperone [Pseudanabaenaceae cyanobacterium]
MKRNGLVLALSGVLTMGTVLPVLAQPTIRPTPTGEMRKKWTALNLTEAQKEEMQQLRAKHRQQMEALLTPAQRAELTAAWAEGRRPYKLNLSDAQKEQMRSLRAQGRQEMLAVLTPEQQVTWRTLRVRRGPNRPAQ